MNQYLDRQTEQSVTAISWNGSRFSANQITSWVSSRGGKIVDEADKPQSRRGGYHLKFTLGNEKLTMSVGDFLVLDEAGSFLVLSHTEFHSYYKNS